MKKNRQKQIALVRSLIEGIGKRFPKATKLTVGSREFTPHELVSLFQEYLDTCDADDVAQANARKVKQSLRDSAAATEPTVGMFKTLLLGMYADPTDLADFGLVPRKPPVVKTSEELAFAARKRSATRKERGVMGKRQRRKAEKLSAQANTVEPAAANVPPPKSNGAPAG
jgi:hypothetical protein